MTTYCGIELDQKGPGYTLLSDSTKPLPKPLLTGDIWHLSQTDSK